MKQRDLAALFALLERRAFAPHEWGRKRNDCLSFLAAAVFAQTGVDPARGLRWTDKKSALRLLKRLGGVEAVLDARFDRIPIAQAHRGDIAAIADPELGIHPMLMEGATLCAPGPRGLMRAPRAAALLAWDAMSVRKAVSARPNGTSKGKGRQRRQRLSPERAGAADV